jgi:hypothetical protein
MRRKRLLLWAFVAVVAVALELLTVIVLITRPGVTQENYDRITYGMTLVEVQGLLGGEGEEWEPMGNTWPQLDVGKVGFGRTWRGDGLTVYVSFQDGHAWQRAWMKDGYGESESPSEPFPACLLHLLPW